VHLTEKQTPMLLLLLLLLPLLHPTASACRCLHAIPSEVRLHKRVGRATCSRSTAAD
jgi:hypothetical protein